MKQLTVVPIAIALLLLVTVQTVNTQHAEMCTKQEQTEVFELEQENTSPTEENEATPCLWEHLTGVCNHYGVDADFMLALIKIESNFSPKLISKTNDWGLCQINICNHEKLKKALGITDFLDPYQNIECGVFLIAELQAKYPSATDTETLMRYNLGETGARKLFNKGIHETHYARKHQKALKEKRWGL